MRLAQGSLAVATAGQGLVEITRAVADWLQQQAAGDGLLTLFIRHTSASLLIQENAVPEVRRDLEDFLRRLVPEDPSLYRHDEEGPDDMPAHIKAALLPTRHPPFSFSKKNRWSLLLRFGVLSCSRIGASFLGERDASVLR